MATKKRNLTDEEKKELLKNATISNGYVFVSVMRNEKIAKIILEIILGIKIKKIKVIEYEKTLELKLGKKGIRLDIYLESDDTIYNIEMQVEDEYNLVLRARYYSSLLDLNKLEKGEDYNLLSTAYVIFICMFDPFGKGQAKYVFSNQCKLDNGEYISMGDNSYKVYLNVLGYMNTDDENLKDFLEYVATQKTNNNEIKKIDNEIKHLKSNQKWGIEYMTFLTNQMDDTRIKKELRNALKKEQQERKKEQQERKKEQEERKKEQEVSKQLLINQLKMFDDSVIAQLYGKSVEEVAKLREELLGE